MSAPRNEVMKMELCEPGKEYALTLAPSDDKQFWGECKLSLNGLSRVRMFYEQQKVSVYTILKRYDYKLDLECSPLGRLHWHGTIKFKNDDKIIDFYVNTVPNLIKGYTICVKPIKKQDGWDTYCKKQNRFFAKYSISSADKINKLAIYEEAEVVFVHKKIIDDY